MESKTGLQVARFVCQLCVYNLFQWLISAHMPTLSLRVESSRRQVCLPVPGKAVVVVAVNRRAKSAVSRGVICGVCAICVALNLYLMT